MPISNTYSPNAPTGKTSTGSAVSNREDLSNELSLLAPEETPILSLCSKGKATATFSEWTVDSLAAPVTTGISEGSDVTSFSDKFADRARLGNYVQLMRRDYLVSNLQQAVTSVGPANVAQAEAKSMREIKRDIEATIASANEMTVENGAGTPYGMRGLGAWLQVAAQGTNPVPTAYRTPTGSILTSTPTETTFNNMIGSIFSKNGEMNSLTLVANTALRTIISGFSRTSSATNNTYTINQEATSKTITLSVNLYDSDFGMVKIINGNPSCMPSTTNIGYVLNPKYLGFNTLIPMGATRLENQGGGERGFVDVAGTLCVKHPQAHGKIAVS
jgi:Family of unknown function (DUF5309)